MHRVNRLGLVLFEGEFYSAALISSMVIAGHSRGSGYAYPSKSSRSGSGGAGKNESPKAFALSSGLWIYGAAL